MIFACGMRKRRRIEQKKEEWNKKRRMEQKKKSQ
jgi:hypothetical protein